MNRADFVKSLSAAAVASAKITGIPASFTVAQAVLESGWGTSDLCRGACNIFGVKADSSWRGETIDLPTKEYVDGKPITVIAKWRKYQDFAACLIDRATFLKRNPRYRLAFTGQRTGEDFARQIAAAGYATDPRYAEKLCSIIRSNNFSALDK